MSVTITINGELTLDQTAGIQEDDVATDVVLGQLTGGLDSQFLNYLNTLGLSADQLDFAALVEGASEPNLVSVVADNNETIGKLFFSDSTGNDFDGDLVPDVTLLDGSPLYFWTAQNGKVVLVTTSPIEGDGSVAAAFYIESNAVDNSSAKVESVTFMPLAHPDAGDPNDPVDFSDILRVSAVITQGVGDDIIVLDDAPSIVTSTDSVQLTVDETDLTTDDTDGFAAEFSSDFGTDGGTSITYALGVLAPDTDSGLVDTATGEAVLLSLNGTVVEGRSATGGLVFTVSVDASGNVSLNQLRAISHPNDTDHNDSLTLSADDLVTLTATITDADGDTDSAVQNIGQNLNFLDDGPDVGTTGEVPVLAVDETDFGTDDVQSFAANFTSSFGADGEGSLVYALGVVDGPSGLVDTLTGEDVLLSLVSGVVEGRTGSGDLVFTVSVDQDANVTLDQLRSVVHSDTTSDDEDTTLSAADLVTLTATITDGDNDTDAATIDIGQSLLFGDDGPSILPDDQDTSLTVDETDLGVDASDDFSTSFIPTFGNDEAGSLAYALDVVAGPSGLTDTASNEAVILSVTGGGVVEGRTEFGGDLVFTAAVDAAGVVTLDQQRAVVHPDDTNPDDSVTLAADDLVTLTGTITDGDGDSHSTVINIGQNLNFEDDGPSITASGAPPSVTVDETSFSFATANFAGNFTSDPGEDGAAAGGGITYDLDIGLGAVGLTDTDSGEAVNVQKVGSTIEARTAIGNLLVFSIAVAANGDVTLTQARSVVHANTADPNDARVFSAADVVTLTATITDKDGDTASDTLDISPSFTILDDGPVITVPVDGNTTLPGNQAALQIDNVAPVTGTGNFGYDVGNDTKPDAAYALGYSDFVDTNGTLAGTQISLTGYVGDAPGSAITGAVATRFSEDSHDAVFNFSFAYDKDPVTAGVQTANASGTLSFDKDADTFSFALNAPIEGFELSVLHTNELLAKAPPGNTGHPEIVVTELDHDNVGDPPDGFYVQFTANSNPNGSPFGFNLTGDGSPQAGNTAFNNGEMATSNFEDWVSATQSTNGVAGDTIQKGELLTMRFFETNILSDVVPGAPGGGTEKTVPTATADGIAIKFDGVGNSEDLVVILDLYDDKGTASLVDDVHTTRAVNVQNSDLIKGVVPAPYNSEFSLDNNDALLVMESNDYNAAGEHFQIQGVQIMQSGNGLTGNAINLNGAIGANGGSNATGGLTAFDVLDNDVLKITDIGFIQTSSGTLPAHLDFGFQIKDGDGDTTVVQHVQVDVSNDFLI